MRARTLATLAAVALITFVSPPAVLADGAATFKSRCAPCHGQDGSGNTPMGKKLQAKALGSAAVQKLSDAELQKLISDGKGKMPGFAGKLPPAEITAMVKVVRTFAAK